MEVKKESIKVFHTQTVKINHKNMLGTKLMTVKVEKFDFSSHNQAQLPVKKESKSQNCIENIKNCNETEIEIVDLCGDTSDSNESEIKFVDLSENTNNLIEMKQESNSTKIDKLTEECDLRPVKRQLDISNLLNRPSSSRQLQGLQRSKKGVVKKTVKKWKRYPCLLCGKKFAMLISRKKHFNVHFQKKSVVCPSCGKIFNNKAQFLDHNTIHRFKKRRLKHILKLNEIKEERPHRSNGYLTNYSSTTKSAIVKTLTFACNVCGNPFYSRQSLDSHLKTHTNIFSCDLCPKYFNRKSTLTQHKLTHFGPQFKCEICPKLFKSKSNRNRHELTHTQRNNTYFKCNMCPQKFCKTSSFVNHWFVHQGKMDATSFQCKLCNIKFDKVQKLIDHCQNHFNNKFRCFRCPKSFWHSKHFQSHMKMHSEKKPHGIYCGDCGENFYLEKDLIKHLNVHNKPFQCGICLLRHKDKDKLLDHIAKHTSDKDKKTLIIMIKCKICSKPLFGEAAFNRHLRATHIKKPLSCELCLQIFIADNLLLQHLVSHHDESNFMGCPFCKSKLFTKDTLQYHLDTKHSDLKESDSKKPFTCRFCPMSFLSLSALENHLAGDKLPVSCKICSTNICNRDSLVKHLQDVHIKSSLSCTVCSREYTDKEALITHLVSEQGNECTDYFKQCEVCRWNFFNELEFNQHCKEYHYLPCSDVCSESQDYNDFSVTIEDSVDVKDEFDIVYRALEIKEETIEYSGFFDLC